MASDNNNLDRLELVKYFLKMLYDCNDIVNDMQDVLDDNPTIDRRTFDEFLNIFETTGVDFNRQLMEAYTKYQLENMKNIQVEAFIALYTILIQQMDPNKEIIPKLQDKTIKRLDLMRLFLQALEDCSQNVRDLKFLFEKHSLSPERLNDTLNELKAKRNEWISEFQEVYLLSKNSEVSSIIALITYLTFDELQAIVDEVTDNIDEIIAESL